MKKIISIITLTLATLFIGCGSAIPVPAQKQALIDNSTTLYTKVGMWTERNRIDGTNYPVGLHLPVNTEVKILAVNAKVITLEINGKKISYLTATKHTKIDSIAMIDRLFSTTKTDISGHSPATIENINNGTVAMGMTKEEVLLARGYPPFSATAGVEANRWKYWRNRWVTALVTFRDGKVTKIDGSVS